MRACVDRTWSRARPGPVVHGSQRWSTHGAAGCHEATHAARKELLVDTPATYLHWEFVLISVPNLILLLAMIAIFVVAVLAPFPRHVESGGAEEQDRE